jgi:hypothetical protein
MEQRGPEDSQRVLGPFQNSEYVNWIYAMDGTDQICCQLKEHFLIVQTLCGLSGFGWDDAKHMVTTPDNVWD